MENNQRGNAAVLLLVWVAFGLLIGGWLFEYSFEYWASYFKGQVVDLPFWIAMIGGVVLSGATLPIAFITLLCSLFM